MLYLWIVIEFSELSLISVGLLVGWRDKHYKLCKLIQYVQNHNLIWSSVVPAMTADIMGCPLSQLLLSVPCRSGESCCLLLSVFLCRRCIRNWDFITSHLSMSPLNWIVISVPFLLPTYEAPKREIRSTLSPPPGSIFPSHPASCCQSQHLPPCTMGVFYKCCPTYLLIATALLCVL